MASLRLTDDALEIDKKMKIISYFLDCFSASRIVNPMEFNWNSNKSFLFGFIKELCDLDSKQVAMYCKKILLDRKYTVDGISMLELNGHNSRKVKYVLSRLTSFVSEKVTGSNNQFGVYESKKPSFDIEHVLARKAWNEIKEKNSTDYGFIDETDFNKSINRIGNLILLESSINRSLSDKLVSEKLSAYPGSNNNPLRSSLKESYYQNNPRFRRIVGAYYFKPVKKMSKCEIEERCLVYQKIAEDIWNPNNIDNIYSQK